MSIRHKYLIERLRDAYEANRIPVDARTAAFHDHLPDKVLLENAIYWEARASGDNPEAAITTEAALQIIRAAEGGAPPNGTSCGRKVMHHDLVYHGSIRD